MKKKEEFLNTKFSKNYYKEKHINSQYNKKEYKPIIENIISLEKTKIEENTKIPIMTNSLPINIPQIKDQDGIKKAYDRDSKLYINADTMYVGGTSSVQDMYDDLKIPFFKLIRHYAIKMLNCYWRRTLI